VSETRSYKRPESVLVVVHTQDLECLLLERVHPQGFWQSVTGSLRWDETPLAAAARELEEETGLDPAGMADAGTERSFPILPAWRHRYPPDVSANLEHWFYLAIPQACAVRLNPGEHRGYEWLALEPAIERASSWTNREALQRLRGGGG
jgi:dATP pyrophosphohydrolase